MKHGGPFPESQVPLEAILSCEWQGLVLTQADAWFLYCQELPLLRGDHSLLVSQKSILRKAK